MIVSCRSNAAPIVSQELVGASYAVMAGTSMAAPFVTGLVALLLQRNPHLDPPAVKALLKANCVWNGTVSNFHPKRGSGVIDTNGL